MRWLSILFPPLIFAIALLLVFNGSYVSRLLWQPELENGVWIFEDYDYYSIYGSTAAELREQMSRKGPRRHWAYVRWYVKWTEECDVTLTLDIDLPYWKDKKSGPLGLQTKWDKMFEVLLKHEMQHREHGRQAAFEIKKMNCLGANSIVRSWSREDTNYDSMTGHGRREGVVLVD